MLPMAPMLQREGATDGTRGTRIADAHAARSALDATVAFLPNRLNRQPVIVRGLTADELWVTAGLSAIAGLLIGIPFAFALRSLATAPACIVATVAFGIFAGGSVIRRLKRGRPDTWVYRALEWQLCTRFPSLCTRVGLGPLVTRSGHWSTRRTRGKSPR